MGKEIDNSLGKVIITAEVVATVAGVAATECYGIVGMASRKLKDGLSELLGRENLSRGVVVTFDRDKVLVELFIIVGYGVNIQEVSHNVIERVRYALRTMLNLEAARVVVNVQGIRVDSHT